MSVYFVLAGDVNRVKIGTSRNPEGRFEALYLLSPIPIELLGEIPGGFQEERAIHDRFAHLRRHGEWFEYADDLRVFVESQILIAMWNKASTEVRTRFMKFIRQDWKELEKEARW